MSIVRTVLGDVAPGDLGITYLHEHLIIDSPLVADRFSHIYLPSVEDAVSEATQCAGAGVGAMVDSMPCSAGRNVVKLAEVSRRAGVHVIAATGLHTARYYDGHPWTAEESPDVLTDLFAADVEDGIDRHDYTGPVVRRTPHRAGIIKVATLGVKPDERETRVFEAAAATHQRTGAPIITHCEGGEGAPAQIELLQALGVRLERVVLSHTDKRSDPGYHRELLGSGVNLEYDQALRQDPDERRGTAWLVSQMLTEGFGRQLMLGTDGARRALWQTLGGSPGLAWLAAGFAEILEGWGIDDAARHALFVENPARFLAFESA